MNKGILEVDGVVVTQDVIDKKFTCDLSKCKGACCTMESDYGAPVDAEEIEKINKNWEGIKDYLPSLHRKAIEKSGFWERKEGQLLTKSINNRECVFVYYEGDIAKCGIEKAYFDGKSDFRKPVSCHLFPIRVSDFGGKVLRFEEYSECVPALEKGEKTKITVLDFCRDALVRFLGKPWFGKIKNVIQE